MAKDLITIATKNYLKKNPPKVRPGETVRVHQKIREGNKERVQIFEGVVIATHKRSTIDATFTVRRIASGVGVERIFPLHSPRILKVERVKTAPVKRAKLYYLRGLAGRAARLKNEKFETKVWEERGAEEELEKLEKEQAKEAETKAEQESADAKKETEAEADKETEKESAPDVPEEKSE